MVYSLRHNFPIIVVDINTNIIMIIMESIYIALFHIFVLKAL